MLLPLLPTFWTEREEPVQAASKSAMLIFKLNFGATLELTFGLGAPGAALIVTLVAPGADAQPFTVTVRL